MGIKGTFDNLFKTDANDIRGFNHWTKTGIMFNYIGSILFVALGITMLALGQVIVLSIGLIIASILCIVLTYMYQTRRTNQLRWAVGLMGSFFGLFVGGICILLNDNKNNR